MPLYFETSKIVLPQCSHITHPSNFLVFANSISLTFVPVTTESLVPIGFSFKDAAQNGNAHTLPPTLQTL